jgi:hypothetical protein
MCEMRLAFTAEVEKTVQNYAGTYYCSIKEVNGLRDLCKTQISLFHQMIRGHLQQLTKETKDERD